MEKKTVIEFENYSFKYFSQSENTLNDINLTIYEGERVLILGASGSGKSTLGNCLNGIIPFAYKGNSTGTLKIKGQATSNMSIFDRSKLIGTVLQDTDGQFVGLTVGEDIAFSLENQMKPKSEMDSIVSKIAKTVHMDKFLKKSPFELSGGQKQRVSVGGVMVDNLDILLFDEPLANLDPQMGKQTMELINEIHTKNNTTIIIIEHRLEDVLTCEIDRVVLMEHGSIIYDGTPNNLMCTDILTGAGLREPLHIKALKYAGVEINEENNPAYINKIIINENDKRKIIDWNINNHLENIQQDGEDILTIKDLTFGYTKGTENLKNININLKKGEMVSIVGTNGAGKSTLAKLICGFVKPNSGDILYKNKSINKETIKQRADKIGYVMQNPNQMICKPMIFDEVALGLKLRGYDDEYIKERVTKVLKICGLYQFINWPISALSFGQKKRVTIASMLVTDPEILILDEPTAGQDYKHYTDILKFLQELNKMGITIILITHDMHLMLEYTTRTIAISDGGVIADSSPSYVLTNNEITQKASLTVTSLYELCSNVGIDDAQGFVYNFINYESEV